LLDRGFLGLLSLFACVEGAIRLMDYIDKVLEKLKDWARKLIDALLGPEPQPEPEPIPVPVNDRERRR
jgi:hypothetical protein